MEDYRKLLSKAGWVLIVIGLIDIAFMVYCIVNQISYSSSFNIFAVIAGIFLIRGNLKAARIISFFTAVFIAGMVGMLIFVPRLIPLDLIYAYLKIKPLITILYITVGFVSLFVLVWLYRTLTSSSVKAAMDGKKINYTSFWRKPARGFWFGGCLVVILIVILSLFLGGETADKAKQKAAAEVGSEYKLHVSSINIATGGGSKSVHAVVTAYNDHKIKTVNVDWSE